MAADDPKTPAEIAIIEQNPAQFIADISKPRSTHYLSADNVLIERVPQEDWWYVDGNEFIGRISAKLYLNDHLLNDAGNIGYGVRPTRRGQGHATDMVNLVLDYYRNTTNLTEVLITCSTDNIASTKVIEKCGGVLEDIRPRHSDGKMFKRYWIAL